jgi:orotidine-5'-phosphate decarboxylase
MSKSFADKLIEQIKAKGNPICVGLDPRLDKIPAFIKREAEYVAKGNPFTAAAEAIIAFNKAIIDEIYDVVPVVKPQIAFYEIFGHEGIRAYEETLKYAKKKGLITIADAKRNDIGSTAEAYAKAFLGEVTVFEGEENEVITPIFDADAITVNGYLGVDGIKPFIEESRKYNKGLFVLVKTSNKSSCDLQDVVLADGLPVYEFMGHLVESWGADDISDSGYNFVGAVVGATFPKQAAKLRKVMPNTIFLVPGYGAQGGTAEDVKPCFNEDGLGAIVNSSREIIFAYEKMPELGEAGFAKAARKACEKMKNDLASIFK